MDTKELWADKFVNDWFVTLSVKDSTKRRYIDGMRLYTDLVGKSPKELIEEAEADIKSGTLMRERRIREYLLRFRAVLNDNVKRGKFAPTTAELRWYAIKSFYKAFDIDLPRNIQNGDSIPKRENMNLKFNKESIRKMLMSCKNVRDRAIILTAKSSGLAKNEVIHLTYGQFREGYDATTKITTISMRREKVGFDFITFIDPEGTEAVREYLKVAMRVTKDGEFDSNYDHLPLFTTSKGDMDKLSDISYMTIFRSIAVRMHAHELSKKGEPIKYNPLRSHNLRKFFNTQLKNHGLNGDVVEFMMGHTGDRTKAAYYLHDVETLKEQYIRHMHALAIYTDGKSDTDILIANQKLKAEVERLKAEDTLERAYNEMLEDEQFVKQLYEKLKTLAPSG